MVVFSAIITQEEELYIAQCPEIGTTSQGRSVEEAVKNLKEATEAYLEEFPSWQIQQVMDTALPSERSLAKEWNAPGEDEAWKQL